MNIFLWILILILFGLSFVGLIFPVLPSVLLLWIGFLLYQFALHGTALTAVFWWAMAILTILIFLADILANSYFVKRYGGSAWGRRAGALGIIVGSFIFPPFGLLIVPFIAVLITEILLEPNVERAFRASIGSLIGFLSSSVAKLMIQLVMILWFFFTIWF
ncbi:DUF456 domain-containing protein [Rubeoparvulum massiliense]|uniref:DUF456 domain-containing protein n=1 Tax=Rubeoparvulum massiliense TaxID=1631346 RepID=UPI00065E2BF1|nr:DUF456 domain-containing protein [Rubeoparvulum massiliense]